MMAKLQKEQLANCVICSSAGNHAQGVAVVAKTLGCDVVIVMSITTPLIKVSGDSCSEVSSGTYEEWKDLDSGDGSSGAYEECESVNDPFDIIRTKIAPVKVKVALLVLCKWAKMETLKILDAYNN
ncbi:hypothetical protein M8C21_026391 [Ambrosia artemisiifolia]|uniref:Tryptophan synthase beta chain-like PALP domain-containing protein n=1 Tax=Ambrosia artemisiifolia TaxID=4212 RepID=A0AAD5BW35_AMBAR|nr:hypothetical protein M8C21_026391 [Ambrosia artemisiifolia]